MRGSSKDTRWLTWGLVLSLGPACGDDSPATAVDDTGTGGTTGTTGGSSETLSTSVSASGTGSTTTTDGSTTDMTTGMDSTTGVAPTCGDAMIGGAEDCDDGNTDPDDGCDATCMIEPGWMCDAAEPTTCTADCGDSMVVGTEECDDGNNDPDDGCDASCALEPGWMCTGEPSVCEPTCGDGALTGAEECDDGNTDADDGCSPNCAVESGWMCMGEPSTCAPTCGDGALTGTEECDDGGTDPNDGCSDTCMTEAGWMCSGEPSTCTEQCGDGLVVGAEGCDDGNTNADDGCSDVCAVETGWMCSGEPSTCAETCGDGLIVGTEGCDDGNTNIDDGCSDVCAIETGWDCMGEPSACDPICGDDLIVGSEPCDGANLGGQTCFDFGGSLNNGTLACDVTCNFDLAGCLTQPGDICLEPFVASPPFFDSNDTLLFEHDYGYSENACLPETNDYGNAARDTVYAFVAAQDTDYFVQLDATYDANLYVATDCTDIDNSCVIGDEDVLSGMESVQFGGASGTEYFVIVDGWSNTNPDNAGTYDIDIWRVGDVCQAPVVIDANNLPVTISSDSTLETGNDYGYSAGACPGETSGFGAGSTDMAFSFTPSTTGDYEITLTPTGWDSNLYVVTDCADVDNTCVGAKENVGSGAAEVVTATLTQGTTYFVIVDGWGNFSSQSGPFTLDVVAL